LTSKLRTQTDTNIKEYQNNLVLTESYLGQAATKAEQQVSSATVVLQEVTTNRKVTTADLKKVEDCENTAKEFADYSKKRVAAANALLSQLKKFRPNPPVDALLHSLQFVVTYGVSVSPSWTLIHWKGPSPTGSFASGSGNRTHLLQIALGAPNSGELQRLILNQTVLSVLTTPPR
jgi:hypothetical protein